MEHHFKLLINLHRDGDEGDDGGGLEGRDGEIAPQAIEGGPAAAEGVVDHLHKEYAPRFPRFSSSLPYGSAYATSLFWIKLVVGCP